MRNKYDYILSVFRQVYEMGEFYPDIDYAENSNAKIVIRPGNNAPLLTCDAIALNDLQISWNQWKGNQIPFFFSPEGRTLYSKEGNHWIIHVDLIASAFYLISGWHEYFSSSRDAFGRFPYAESIQSKLGILHLPVVNYYLDILKTVIEEAYQTTIESVRWQQQHSYTAFLSHDIDSCESAWLEGGFDSLRKKDFKSALTLLVKKAKGNDGWFNFDDILSLEKKYQANSTFFFLVKKNRQNGLKNADYSFSTKKVQQTVIRIREMGSEVGIHGSIGSGLYSSQFPIELDLFAEKINGNRFHFLLYDPVKTPLILEHSTILYDASLGFAEQMGFRNSFCFPFYPYDISGDSPLTYLEFPLMIMDGTLQKYMGISPQNAFEQIKPIIEEVERFNGCVSILWHNTFLSGIKYPGWREVYKKLLSYFGENNVWMTSGEKIISHYIDKSGRLR